MEWCKEVEDAIQIVVCCSMDPATLDKQVDHIHGLQGAVAGHVEVGKDYQLEGVGMDCQFEEEAHGKEAASAASSYRGRLRITRHLWLLRRSVVGCLRTRICLLL